MEISVFDGIIRMIKEVGFPAVAFLLLWYFMCKTMAPRLDNLNKSVNDLSTGLKNHLTHTIGELKDSVDKNTDVTNKLGDRIDKKFPDK